MHWRTISLSFAAMLTIAFAGSANGEGDDRGTLDGMRACARIDDTDQRTACYDGFLRPKTRPAAPASGARAGSPVAIKEPGDRARKTLKQNDAGKGRSTEVVSAAVERAPGIYRLTMANGAEWEFASATRATYDPPARGATVEILPGALGSYLLSYNDQSVVRVVRVR